MKKKIDIKNWRQHFLAQLQGSEDKQTQSLIADEEPHTVDDIKKLKYY